MSKEIGSHIYIYIYIEREREREFVGTAHAVGSILIHVSFARERKSATALAPYVSRFGPAR